MLNILKIKDLFKLNQISFAKMHKKKFLIFVTKWWCKKIKVENLVYKFGYTT